MSEIDPVVEQHSVLAFWGKAQHATDAGDVTYHPVAFHSLDVAACIKVALEQRPVTRARLAWLLGIDESAAVNLVVALTALHDIGKFGVAFQAKRPDLWPSVLGTFTPAPNSRHTSDGYLLWEKRIAAEMTARLWPEGGDVLDALAPSIFGHHGRPVACPESVVSRVFGVQSIEAARKCAHAMLEILLPEPVSTSCIPDRTRSRIAGWWIAGLVTFAEDYRPLNDAKRRQISKFVCFTIVALLRRSFSHQLSYHAEDLLEPIRARRLQPFRHQHAVLRNADSVADHISDGAEVGLTQLHDRARSCRREGRPDVVSPYRPQHFNLATK